MSEDRLVTQKLGKGSVKIYVRGFHDLDVPRVYKGEDRGK